MVALYRIAELTSGQIVIDGRDVSKLGLNALRTKIASELASSQLTNIPIANFFLPLQLSLKSLSCSVVSSSRDSCARWQEVDGSDS